MFPIFPLSPLPAALQTTRNWGENQNLYDSGAMQGDTAFVKPLFVWNIPVPVMNELKRFPIIDFIDETKGMTLPFLIKDAYEYQVASQQEVASGVTNGSTGFFTDAKGFMVRPDTTTVGSIFSVLSGFVTLGHEYSIEQDTGIVTVNTKAVNDVWFVHSMEYFRKAVLNAQYQDTATIWNIWGATIQVTEIP
jgi:hypothetical protein